MNKPQAGRVSGVWRRSTIAGMRRPRSANLHSRDQAMESSSIAQAGARRTGLPGKCRFVTKPTRLDQIAALSEFGVTCAASSGPKRCSRGPFERRTTSDTTLIPYTLDQLL
jgi:hypothetical protein